MSKAAKSAKGWSGAVKPGRSILEVIWEELDSVVERLLSEWGKEPDEGDDEEWLEYGEVRGQAQGLAYSIATIMNPVAPDVDEIRGMAMERAESREATGSSTPPAKEWEDGVYAYHRGRKVRILSVGTEFAFVSSETVAKFSVPIHELTAEMEEALS